MKETDHFLKLLYLTAGEINHVLTWSWPAGFRKRYGRKIVFTDMIRLSDGLGSRKESSRSSGDDGRTGEWRRYGIEEDDGGKR